MIFHDIFLIITQKIVPLLYAIIGFGGLIAIHEGGHLLFCKLFGIYAPTFSIGFGPELFRKQIGSTNFRLALIPLGGYVEMAGNAEFGQGEQKHAAMVGDSSYESKPYWQKLLVSLGGIIFNLLFAYLVFCGLFLSGSSNKQAVMVVDIVKESAAAKAGLKAGDAILSIQAARLNEGEEVASTPQELALAPGENLIPDAQQKLLAVIQANPNSNILITLERSNQEIVLPVTLGSKSMGERTIGSLGANFLFPLPKLPLFQAIKAGFDYTNQNILLIIDSIKRLFCQRSLDGAGGPLMIISMSASSAQHGVIPLLIFLALLSINLALINLLPIGALDGGQLFFISIEALLRRKLPQALKNTIDIGSWVLFLGLFAFLTYRDIVHLFGTKLSWVYHFVLSFF
ncbi:PDZ domain-containing protein [Candidatus Dependentiae bacterium]|nr:PDZ domain-containing protein [Candidatus Dependentiae bacterium]